MTPEIPVSPEGNVLRAAFGEGFSCFFCRRSHGPKSQLIQRCLSRLQQAEERHGYIDGYEPSVQKEYTRRAWLQALGQWEDEAEQHRQALRAQLEALRVPSQVILPTREELAAPDGPTRYLARVRQARETQQERVGQAWQQALPLLEALARLCPPPFPVGPPTGILIPNRNPWRAFLHPDPPALQEITRVKGLLGPTTRIRVDPVRRTVTLLTRIPVPRWGLGDFLREAFRAPHTPLLRGNRADLEDLGLDPAFWSGVVYVARRKHLQVITRAFQVRVITRAFQVREVDRGAQAPLPLLEGGGDGWLPGVD